jgi:DNA invertase Pin-like site-specific DNA recombinase
MTTRVYAYLRASTKEQDASRAKQQLDEFAQSNGMTIATYFTENESGASLQRPELFRLLEIAQKGDVMLVEQVDRLSRLVVKMEQVAFTHQRERCEGCSAGLAHQPPVDSIG